MACVVPVVAWHESASGSSLLNYSTEYLTATFINVWFVTSRSWCGDVLRVTVTLSVFQETQDMMMLNVRNWSYINDFSVQR